jgi:hypothetical protein
MAAPIGRAYARVPPDGPPEFLRVEWPEVPARYEVVEVIDEDTGKTACWAVFDSVPADPSGQSFLPMSVHDNRADAEWAAGQHVVEEGS